MFVNVMMRLFRFVGILMFYLVSSTISIHYLLKKKHMYNQVSKRKEKKTFQHSTPLAINVMRPIRGTRGKRARWFTLIWNYIWDEKIFF